MRVLLVLSAFLAVSYAAPQFVFVLPQGIEQLLQDGQTPQIKPFTIDQFPTAPAAEPTPEAEVQLVEDEVSPVLESGPNVDLVPEAVLVEEFISPMIEAKVVTEVATEEVDPTTQETTVPVEEVIVVEEVIPIEPVVEEAITIEPVVEEVITIEPVVEEVALVSENEVIVDTVLAADTVTVVEPVAAVEAAPASEAVATGKSLLSAVEPAAPVTAAPIKFIPAPAVNQIDPLAHVDNRFRGFIYPNDSPDVIAAKVALFQVHASRIPVIKPVIV